MAKGPERGLALIDDLINSGGLKNYYLLPSAQADMYRRLGQKQAAKKAYQQALKLVGTEQERRFLEERLRELDGT